jgi:Raf kinase inhibitor-like YbhB/YbcL family protein
MGGALILTLVLKAASFAEGQPIPKEHTCDGADRSPRIDVVDQLPAGTQSWALIVDDPDAPGGTFVHWVIWNLPMKLRTIPDGVPREVLQLPDRSMQGKNGFGNVGWNGPCPPPGAPHRYRFRVFAVDSRLDLPARALASDLERAVKGHLTGQGTLTGTYGRK